MRNNPQAIIFFILFLISAILAAYFYSQAWYRKENIKELDKSLKQTSERLRLLDIACEYWYKNKIKNISAPKINSDHLISFEEYTLYKNFYKYYAPSEMVFPINFHCKHEIVLCHEKCNLINESERFMFEMITGKEIPLYFPNPNIWSAHNIINECLWSPINERECDKL